MEVRDLGYACMVKVLVAGCRRCLPLGAVLGPRQRIMDELELDIESARAWFALEERPGYSLVRVSVEASAGWSAALGVPVRRCYVSDSLMAQRSSELGITEAEVIASALPDPGSTMSGDFGEILVLIFNCASEVAHTPVNPKKWRLKQDRTKPAPHSDVLNFVLPNWPAPSGEDVLVCSEVKAKATDGGSTPITSAIADCSKDRTSRLGRTLGWLKERAIREDLGAVTLAHLDRFLNATDHPPFTKRFRAVAVVCSSLLEQELAAAPPAPHPDYTVYVISVPELRRRYTEVFEAAANSGV